MCNVHALLHGDQHVPPAIKQKHNTNLYFRGAASNKTRNIMGKKWKKYFLVVEWWDVVGCHLNSTINYTTFTFPPNLQRSLIKKKRYKEIIYNVHLYLLSLLWTQPLTFPLHQNIGDYVLLLTTHLGKHYSLKFNQIFSYYWFF